MAGRGEYPLSLIIRAVDKATAPLREINRRLRGFTAPVRKLSNSFRALADEAGLPRLVAGFRGVGQSVGRVGSEVMALGAKLAALAAGGGLSLYALVRSAVDAGDKLGEMAQRTGLAVDTYAQLQFAAAQADVEQEQFNAAMDQFNRRLGEARAGGGSMLAFLQKVSPTLAAQVRASASTEEALSLLAGAFEKVEDPGKRAALAAAAFGKSGLQMGQFLGQGTAALEEQRKKFAELAGSQEAFARGAGELDNAMRETAMAFGGLRNAASAALFPALTELARAITQVVAGSRGSLADWARDTGAALAAWVQGGGVTRLVESLRSMAQTIGTVVGWLGGLKGVLAIVAAFMAANAVVSVVQLGGSLIELGQGAAWLAARLGGLLAPALGSMVRGIAMFNFAPLLAGVGAAAKAIWAFNVALWANPIVLVIGAIAALAASAYLIYRYWDPIKKFFIDLWDSIVSAFNWAWEKIKPIVDAVMKVVEYSPLGLAVKAGKAVAGTIFGAEEARPELGAAAAAPAQAAAGEPGSARVQVDFVNVPRGARVTPDPGGTADLDLSLGYSMTGT